MRARDAVVDVCVPKTSYTPLLLSLKSAGIAVGNSCTFFAENDVLEG